MNVGILTFHFSDNYGAALQAYALRRWLTEQGHHASFIDYRPAHVERGGRLGWPTSPARLKANLKVGYLALSSFMHQHFGHRGQREKFERFRRHFLGIEGTAAARDNGASLAAAHAFDLIVAGSDQIWSPSQHFGFDPNYFLDFARTFRARKIAYAASFGKDQVSPAEAAQLPGLLHNFDAISVREASGVELVERLAGLPASNVPDPTLLHGGYAELTHHLQTGQEDPYIFCYALRSPDNIRQTAGLLSGLLHCPVLSPHNPHRRWADIGHTVYPDPGEWVALLQRARFVVTNSFHGTVFSLLCHKPFIVAGLTGHRSGANTRARHLLQAVGLEHRFIPAFSPSKAEALLAERIDWDGVDQRLAELRARGKAFLATQLRAATP